MKYVFPYELATVAYDKCPLLNYDVENIKILKIRKKLRSHYLNLSLFLFLVYQY